VLAPTAHNQAAYREPTEEGSKEFWLLLAKDGSLVADSSRSPCFGSLGAFEVNNHIADNNTAL
jgi:hypothetical protein